MWGHSKTSLRTRNWGFTRHQILSETASALILDSQPGEITLLFKPVYGIFLIAAWTRTGFLVTIYISTHLLLQCIAIKGVWILTDGIQTHFRLLIPKFSSKPDLSLELEKLFQLPIRYLVSENMSSIYFSRIKDAIHVPDLSMRAY